jgi:hypothetical protein
MMAITASFQPNRSDRVVLGEMIFRAVRPARARFLPFDAVDGFVMIVLQIRVDNNPRCLNELDSLLVVRHG